MTIELFIAIGSALVSITAVFMQIVRWNGGERKKLLKDADNVQADASDAIAKAAQSLVAPMEERITKLEKENRENRDQIAALLKENEKLKIIVNTQAVRISELERENTELKTLRRT